MVRSTLFAATLAFAGTALAWDPSGHMIVGEIAWTNSSPTVRAKVAELVRRLDTTYSSGRAYNFTTAGCWLDDIRPRAGYSYGPWHYIDAPKTDDGASFTIPAPPHVVWAVEESRKTLQSPVTPEAKAVEALGVLIHVVGDIHQPLHACTWDDRGGNGYLVSGVAFADLYKGARGNLHAFWDQGYRVVARDGRIVESFATPPVTARPEPGQAGVISQAAQAIMTAYPAAGMKEEIAVDDPAAWARESHVLGCTKAYPPGPHPPNNEVRLLPPTFATESQPIAARRVALAGYRLGRVLSELFGP